ncbi:heterokaryon incompatibility protein-domain-containing protein [Ganoderma leucocontextum]|nr:heterokaryon incompatibility protein-domain-containing protein [Ganoderma leucocontextum]
MWLLSTDRAELHSFSNAGAVSGGYAILSHTWDPDGEQTFQEVQDIGRRCKVDGTNPRDHVSAKVRQCCILAEKHGYRWAWVDSCCIDKTSSTELSEAINSMFQWYAQAEVCYAYLADVPGGCDMAAKDSPFRTSRWHTRGWTLQELIAPAIVIFLSKDWEELGMKSTLAVLLEEITRVHHKVLTRDVPHFAFSIAIRMCWAAPRKTTRVEDEAYCLMGLFGASLSTIYGEGRRAFMRLQEEILKDEPDASLFVWSKGRHLACGELGSQDVRLLSSMELPDFDPHGFLLAPSPAFFNIPAVYIPNLGPNTRQPYPPLRTPEESQITQDDDSPFGHIEMPRISTTSYGVKCRFPVFEANGIIVAVLLCAVPLGHIGLVLRRDPFGRDPTRQRYHPGCLYKVTTSSWGQFTARLSFLGTDMYNLLFDGKPVKPEWRTIYIVGKPPVQWTSPDALLAMLRINCDPRPPFLFPNWLLSKLGAAGFDILHGPGGSPLSYQDEPQRVAFLHPVIGEEFHVDLGVCRADSSEVRWARVLFSHPRQQAKLPGVSTPHDCAADHVDTWGAGVKVFGDAQRSVRLSFVPDNRAPATTLITHLELNGPVYENLLRGTNISFPPFSKIYRAKATAHVTCLPSMLHAPSLLQVNRTLVSGPMSFPNCDLLDLRDMCI